MARYRTGRKVGHTLYVQQGAQPSDDDIFIGSCVSPGHAQAIVDEANAAVDMAERLEALEAVKEILQRVANGWTAVDPAWTGSRPIWVRRRTAERDDMSDPVAAVLWPTTEDGPS